MAVEGKKSSKGEEKKTGMIRNVPGSNQLGVKRTSDDFAAWEPEKKDN